MCGLQETDGTVLKNPARYTDWEILFVHKLVLANQSSERWFSNEKKNDTSNQKPIRSHRGVRVSRQNSRLSLQLAAPLRSTFNEKSLTQKVFLAKKVKNISEMEWNSFVCFTVDKENGRDPAKQHRKGINKTHWDWHVYYKYKNHSGSNGSFFRNRFRKISFSCL